MDANRLREKSGWRMLYEIIWNALRVSAAVALCLPASCVALAVATVALSEKSKPVEPPAPKVCGVVSGVMYEFSSEYVPFWPEYEDEGSYKRGSGGVDRGCESNLYSLSLAMNWPELTPGNYFSETFSGIVVTLEPWAAGERGLRETFDFFISEATYKQREAKVFDRQLGLNRVEGVDSVFPNSPRMIFWSERNGHMEQIGRCSWSKYRSKYHRCHFRYLLEDSKAIVKIDFGWDELSEWGEIASRVKIFLASNGIQG